MNRLMLSLAVVLAIAAPRGVWAAETMPGDHSAPASVHAAREPKVKKVKKPAATKSSKPKKSPRKSTQGSGSTTSK